jgi:hypothetical protein
VEGNSIIPRDAELACKFNRIAQVINTPSGKFIDLYPPPDFRNMNIDISIL